MILSVPYVPEFYLACSIAGALSARWAVSVFHPAVPSPLPKDVVNTYYLLIFAAATIGCFSLVPIGQLLGSEVVSGKSIMGGLLFGWFAAEWLKYLLDVRGGTGDQLAIALPLAIGVGRIGCLFAHCCYGIETNGVLSLADNHRQYLPIPIIESVFHLSCLWAVIKYREVPKLQGQLLRYYLLAYAAFRFYSEYWRPYPRDILGMSIFQVAAVVLSSGIIYRILSDRNISR